MFKSWGVGTPPSTNRHKWGNCSIKGWDWATNRESWFTQSLIPKSSEVTDFNTQWSSQLYCATGTCCSSTRQGLIFPCVTDGRGSPEVKMYLYKKTPNKKIYPSSALLTLRECMPTWSWEEQLPGRFLCFSSTGLRTCSGVTVSWKTPTLFLTTPGLTPVKMLEISSMAACTTDSNRPIPRRSIRLRVHGLKSRKLYTRGRPLTKPHS